MIAFESFEKSCPRFASAAPFLCLIDDHLLCPDKPSLLYRFEEQLVQPRVVRQLRMEGGDEEAALAREHRAAVDLGEHLDVRPDLLEPRRADEHRPHGAVEAVDREVRLERGDLAAERVALDGDVHETEVVPVEHDHPGAGAEDGPDEATD